MKITDLPNNIKQNYTTLHHDIGMVQRTNNGWDLWFEDGDLVSATELHSLQVGIIIACLTSWNYMNRYGNPTYEIFGNRSYELLKANKSSMVKYKIQQFFIECLKRMRRVYDVIYVHVSELPNDPYKYYVDFEIVGIDNNLVRGDFTISTDTTKSSSYLRFTYNQPYASPAEPLQIDLYLGNEYGGGIDGEIIYIYVNDRFEGVKGVTDSNGYLSFEYVPTEFDRDAVIRFEYKGNSAYNGCISNSLTFKATPISFKVKDDLLYFISNNDEYSSRIWLGEIVSNVDNVSWRELVKNDSDSWQKLYLLKNDDEKYDAYSKNNLYNKKYSNIVLKNYAKVGEMHLFIEKGEDLFELDKDTVYYIGD